MCHLCNGCLKFSKKKISFAIIGINNIFKMYKNKKTVLITLLYFRLNKLSLGFLLKPFQILSGDVFWAFSVQLN